MKAISRKTEHYKGYGITWEKGKEYPCEITNKGTDEEKITVWYEPEHKFFFENPALGIAREQFEFVEE